MELLEFVPSQKVLLESEKKAKKKELKRPSDHFTRHLHNTIKKPNKKPSLREARGFLRSRVSERRDQGFDPGLPMLAPLLDS